MKVGFWKLIKVRKSLISTRKDGALLGVGTVILSPPFPRNKIELNVVTHHQLSIISALYNDDFGIVTGRRHAYQIEHK
jgi:hypothetical protein